MLPTAGGKSLIYTIAAKLNLTSIIILVIPFKALLN